MSKPYSTDLRERVIEAVESGASRREAVERFEISPQFGDQIVAALAGDGERRGEADRREHSPLEAHATWLLALIAEQPDLTLEEVAAMGKRRIAGSRTAVRRFYGRRTISFKKSLRATEQAWPGRAGAGCGRPVKPSHKPGEVDGDKQKRRQQQ
jgi:transposase